MREGTDGQREGQKIRKQKRNIIITIIIRVKKN